MVWTGCTWSTVPSQPSGLNPPEPCPGQAHVASCPNSAVRLLRCTCRSESDRSFLLWQPGRSVVGVWCSPPPTAPRLSLAEDFLGPPALLTKLDPAVELRGQTARRTQADRSQHPPLEGSPQDRADPPCPVSQLSARRRHTTRDRTSLRSAMHVPSLQVHLVCCSGQRSPVPGRGRNLVLAKEHASCRRPTNTAF